MLALGAVVVAPIVLSQLGLSSVNETLITLARAEAQGLPQVFQPRPSPLIARHILNHTRVAQ